MKRLPFLADALSVVLFVVIGRSTHHHGLQVSGVASTTWPFAVGLCAGWLTVGIRHGQMSTWRSGVLIVVETVTIGMVLRVIAGQGTVLAFIVVALCFLGLLMIGWRLLLVAIRRKF